MHAYHAVALGVAPKRAALAAARGSLDTTLAELTAAQVRPRAAAPRHGGAPPRARPPGSGRQAAGGAHVCARAPPAQTRPRARGVTTRAVATPQARLAAVEAKIASLEAAFAEATAKKASLGAQVEDCRVRLARAGKLIGGLGGERARWQARRRARAAGARGRACGGARSA